MSVFGQWSQGPIHFDASGAIQQGAKPSDVAGPTTPPAAPAARGSGVLPYAPPANGGGSGGGGTFGGFSHSTWGKGDGLTMAGGNPSTGSKLTGGAGDGDMPGPTKAPTDNGGSYGLGGTGAQTQNQFMWAAEDGGVIGDEEDGAVGAAQGADSATVDPMMAVTRTLQYGRKKMGLPLNFYQEQGQDQGQDAQSFDEGGMVGEMGGGDGGVLPTGGAPQQAQQRMPDPRSALQYLTGAGGVSPDIAGALEQSVDPQGQMSPGQRAIAAIAAAPSPDAAFGMMQHYRTRYNAYSGGARAAMDKGDLAQAASNATQAMGNIPTGYDVSFAPAQGGVAMSARKQQGAQQGMQQGAQRRAPGKQKSFDEGGKVEREFLPDSEPSENIDDHRDDPQPEGVINNVDAYDNALASVKKHSEDTTRDTLKHTWDKVNSKAFDDGGYVDDEDQGEDTPAMQMTDDNGDEAPPEQVATEVRPEADEGQPVVLSPEQFKQVMTAGYDKPLDEGWGSFIGKVLSAANPMGSAQAADIQPQRPASAGPQAPQIGRQDEVASITDQNQWQPTPAIMEALRAEQGERSAPAAPQGQQAGAQPQGQAPQSSDERMNAYEKRAEALAMKLFPWASQDNLRSQFIAKQMGEVIKSEGRVDQEQARNRGGLQAQREASQQRIQELKGAQGLQKQDVIEGGRDKRAGNANDSRERMNLIRQQWQQLRSEQQGQIRMLGQQLMSDPSLASNPQKAWQRVQQLSNQMNIDPNSVMDMIKSQGGTQPQQAPQQGAQPGQGGGQQGGQQAPAAGGAKQQGAQGAPSYVVFPSGPYAGKLMQRLPNGNVALVPGQQ